MTITGSIFEETTKALLGGLDARSRDIITRRYGIISGTIETLESIGKEYGVTRERVRQIESQAKKLLSRREDLLGEVNQEILSIFAEHGGILSEDHLFELVESGSGGTLKPQVVIFYLYVLPTFEYIPKADKFGPHWSHPELHHKYSDQVIARAEDLLKREHYPLAEDKLVSAIRLELNVSSEELPSRCIYALLRASKSLARTVFGEWGLASWITTKPRGVGDKAYVVLRRYGKPRHFREITEMINQAQFDQKRAHAQTVHNELIKDDRFVLVGRGLYGLKEWGYIPGTVAQVLEAILGKAKQPLSRDELLRQVLKQRMVKKTTVLLGLQNSQRIQRVEGDRYTLR